MTEPALPARAEKTALAYFLAALLLLAAGAWLVHAAWTSEHVMDADEAVHAIEALRRWDRLEHGELGRFVHDSYFPERWQPPVQDHVRWYPIVHSWSVLPAFALAGPSDGAARVPSVAYWLGAALLVFALARRLAPERSAWSGLVALVLFLGAPNLLTFTPQCLTEPCSLFWCLAAFLAYVRALERPDERRRFVLAGLVTAVAVLAKYDHGLLLLACFGVNEVIRARGRPGRLVRSGAVELGAIPLAVLALWLAHPDKLQAFRDTLAHPAYGSPAQIAFNFVGSWLLEYTSSLAALVLIALGAAAALARLGDDRVRAAVLFAFLATLVLVAKARFQFRYNLVEVPIWFVIAGAFAPRALRDVATWSAARRARSVALGAALVATGLALSLLLAVQLFAPERVLGGLAAVLEPLVRALKEPLGLSLEAREYAAPFAWVAGRTVLLCAVSFASAALAAVGLGVWLLRVRGAHGHGIADPRAPRAFALAAAFAVLPGAAELWRLAPERVAWELEGLPALREPIAAIDAVALARPDEPPAAGRILLGGGWDQLTNNTLRWYLLTGEDGRHLRFDQLEVVGDMIGSLVLPEAPRTEYWAGVLRTGARRELPELVVLLDWTDGFPYRDVVGPEVPLYRSILARRASHELVFERSFDATGLRVQAWALAEGGEPPPVEAVTSPAPDPEANPEANPEAGGGTGTGERTRGPWVYSDKAWRHLTSPLLFR